MTVLLIDDSLQVREVLRFALESEGYRVIEAPDGREGVRLYREHRPALVLLDIIMPEKDGIETVREILAIDPAATIFTMSGADEDYQEVARMLGAKRGFRKPVVMEEMLGEVANHLGMFGGQPPLWTPDVSRITSNPYEFKEDDQEARKALLWNLECLAYFFEYPPEPEFYRAVNGYVKARGTDALVQLSFAARNIGLVGNQLHFIARCPRRHPVTETARVILLFNIGIIEVIEGEGYKPFEDWLLGRLRQEQGPLPGDCSLDSMREYLKVLKEEYRAAHGAARALQRALQEGLDRQEKRQLLMAYTFSEKHRLGKRHGHRVHLHCDLRAAAGTPIRPYCTSLCSPPLDSELDEAIKLLGKRLYEMRSTFVHTASGLLFARGQEEAGFAGQGTLADAYFSEPGRLISYEASMQLHELNTLLRRCAWRRVVAYASVEEGSHPASAPS